MFHAGRNNNNTNNVCTPLQFVWQTCVLQPWCFMVHRFGYAVKRLLSSCGNNALQLPPKYRSAFLCKGPTVSLFAVTMQDFLILFQLAVEGLF